MRKMPRGSAAFVEDLPDELAHLSDMNIDAPLHIDKNAVAPVAAHAPALSKAAARKEGVDLPAPGYTDVRGYAGHGSNASAAAASSSSRHTGSFTLPAGGMIRCNARLSGSQYDADDLDLALLEAVRNGSISKPEDVATWAQAYQDTDDHGQGSGAAAAASGSSGVLSTRASAAVHHGDWPTQSSSAVGQALSIAVLESAIVALEQASWAGAGAAMLHALLSDARAAVATARDMVAPAVAAYLQSKTSVAAQQDNTDRSNPTVAGSSLSSKAPSSARPRTGSASSAASTSRRSTRGEVVVAGCGAAAGTGGGIAAQDGAGIHAASRAGLGLASGLAVHGTPASSGAGALAGLTAAGHQTHGAAAVHAAAASTPSSFWSHISLPPQSVQVGAGLLPPLNVPLPPLSGLAHGLSTAGGAPVGGIGATATSAAISGRKRPRSASASSAGAAPASPPATVPSHAVAAGCAGASSASSTRACAGAGTGARAQLEPHLSLSAAGSAAMAPVFQPAIARVSSPLHASASSQPVATGQPLASAHTFFVRREDAWAALDKALAGKIRLSGSGDGTAEAGGSGSSAAGASVQPPSPQITGASSAAVGPSSLTSRLRARGQAGTAALSAQSKTDDTVPVLSVHDRDQLYSLLYTCWLYRRGQERRLKAIVASSAIGGAGLGTSVSVIAVHSAHGEGSGAGASLSSSSTSAEASSSALDHAAVSAAGPQTAVAAVLLYHGSYLLRCFQSMGPSDVPSDDDCPLSVIARVALGVPSHELEAWAAHWARAGASASVKGAATEDSNAAAAATTTSGSASGVSGSASRGGAAGVGCGSGGGALATVHGGGSVDEQHDDGEDDAEDEEGSTGQGEGAPSEGAPKRRGGRRKRIGPPVLSTRMRLAQMNATARALLRGRALRAHLERLRALLDLVRRREKLKRARWLVIEDAVNEAVAAKHATSAAGAGAGRNTASLGIPTSSELFDWMLSSAAAASAKSDGAKGSGSGAGSAAGASSASAAGTPVHSGKRGAAASSAKAAGASAQSTQAHGHKSAAEMAMDDGGHPPLLSRVLAGLQSALPQQDWQAALQRAVHGATAGVTTVDADAGISASSGAAATPAARSSRRQGSAAHDQGGAAATASGTDLDSHVGHSAGGVQASARSEPRDAAGSTRKRHKPGAGL